jgi:hypothetical protein
MAIYVSPDGTEVHAVQIQGDRTDWLASAGDWETILPDGRRILVQKDYFAAHYRQKFPRAADPETSPVASRSAS